MRILGISGSLRTGSFNTAALHAIGKLLPEGAELEVADLAGLPLYSQDLEANLPAAVVKFKESIKSADAVLIASPEYNYSISGVLKNAIDWASRPKGTNSFDGKPGAILGVSNGRFGTARAYYDAYKILSGLNVHLLNYPQMLVSEGGKKFNEQGQLADPEAVEKFKTFAAGLVDWTQKLKAGGIAK